MALIQTNWHVITGGPCSGKSTTLNAIAFHGYKTIPEAARVMIDEEISKGYTTQQIRNSEIAFQQSVLNMKLYLEKTLQIDEPIFMDRGIWDSIPYMHLANGIEKEIQAITATYKYKNIFLLEQGKFTTDYARIESEIESKLLSELLYQAYTEKGYEVIFVPFLPVSKRVEFILTKM